MSGVNVFDADTDDDLDGVVAHGREATGPVLWCGTGGLARALARGRQVRASRALNPPVLGFFGSDQPLTMAQLRACQKHWLKVSEGPNGAAAVTRHLSEFTAALVSVDLAPGLARNQAAQRIGRALARVAVDLPSRPGTLIVVGGETLRGLCGSLGTMSLRVTGQVAPGLPRSIMHGGHWNGVEVVSKSGAFGEATVWRDLLIENGLMFTGSEA
jgi:uncharacterized protein YgbK (DUF1537 family)